MKAIKFGVTSLCDENAIKKAAEIVISEKERKYVLIDLI